MTEALNSIPLSTQLHIAALIVYLFFVRKVTAFSFVFIAILLLDALHLGIKYWLAILQATPEFTEFVYYAWYLSFGITDFIFVALICYWSDKSQTPLDITSKILVGIYLGLGALQVTTLIERSTIDTGIMVSLYSNGIPIANMVATVLLFGYVTKVVFDNLRTSFKAL